MKKIVLLICLVFVFQAIGASAFCKKSESRNTLISYNEDNYDMVNNSYHNGSCSILFIGSSYFNFNNLPYLFENLAISSGKDIYIDHYGRNGLYLDNHASSSATESKINEHDWDYIILQGVGSLMAYPDYFTDHPVYPALVTLRDKISANCESTRMIFCLPWAFEDGMTWYQDWTDTYEDMQIKIFENTLQYSDEIGFEIAPVGWSWYTVLEEKSYPLHYLHTSDWNHPSLKGSYLMACVIFSTVFLESSIDIPYYGGLLEEEGSYFQTVASHAVLDNLSLWNIEDEGNNTPPETPSILTGPINGEIGEEYPYSTSTVDIDDDEIYFLFDWGDGTDDEWLGPFDSGYEINVTHIWDVEGNYEIRVKAKDTYGAKSEWSDPLQVSMPKNKVFNLLFSQFFERFIECFPMLFLFLQFQYFNELIYNLEVKK